MTNIRKCWSVVVLVLAQKADVEILVRKFSTGLGFLGLTLYGISAFQGAALAADGDTCTPITSVPITISLPGTYCLTKDIATPNTLTAGYAITVSTNDVTIDLGGHTLSNLAAGTGTQAYGIAGISAGANLQNITIRNGTVRGFLYGISLTGPSGSTANSSGHLVENVRADFNRYVGIQVLGAGSVARQNQILHTGGSTAGGFNNSSGLWIAGNGAQALDNVVVDTVASLLGDGTWGILAQDFTHNFTGMVIEGNRVSNVKLNGDASVAILPSAGAYNTLVVNNRIADFVQGILFINTGRYRDNLTIDTTFPYTGGTDEGNNQ
jgi:hypothetical protein